MQEPQFHFKNIYIFPALINRDTHKQISRSTKELSLSSEVMHELKCSCSAMLFTSKKNKLPALISLIILLHTLSSHKAF